MQNLEKIKKFKGTNEIRTNETKIKNDGKKGSNNLLQFSKLQTPNSKFSPLISQHPPLTAHISGITLIALVVTIVILLILAAITINLVLSEGGIFERAQNAEEEHEKAEAREKLELKLADMQAERLVNNRNYTEVGSDYDYLTEQLRIAGFTVQENLVTVDGWQFEIDRSVPKISQSSNEENGSENNEIKYVYTFGDADEDYDGISGTYEEFTAPFSGYYKLEVWGAQGGSGGNGGYSSGYTYLEKGEKLYVYIGGKGEDTQNLGNSTSYLEGGFNGGGNSGKASWWSSGSKFCDCYGSGGGATDIRKVKATEGNWYDENHEDWSTDESLLSRIIVAGGGGGGWGSQSGEVGGGLTTSGATQESGYQLGLGQNGTNGINADFNAEGNGGSGGGYYGGTASTGTYNAGGRGGSGYIGNLIDGKCLSGAELVPDYEGTSVMTGNKSGGYAKITYIKYKQYANQIQNYEYTDATQQFEFNVEKDGYYKLEVWGAQGGSGGKGGYSVGYINLEKGENLYIYLGGAGKVSQNVGNSYLKGGFNGGGNSGIASWYSSFNAYCACFGSGGGATDIRKVKATEGSWYDENHEDWSTDESLLSRIIVAGGGGGSGEAGGGLTTSGATQESGYQLGLGQNGTNGVNAANRAEGNGGSGGGYYGGTASTDTYNAGGRGGSGYIGNLIDGRCLSGTQLVPDYEGTSTMTGNTGNGHAKITFLFY